MTGAADGRRAPAEARRWVGPATIVGRVRLVSMLPSATEIVYALGLADDLVGVTFECDEPAAARAEKVIVVGGRDTRDMAPGQIDRYVREALAAGEDLYTLQAGALAALDPDLILTQDLCRVCALPSGRVEDALSYLGCRADVVSLDPHSLDDVLDTITRIGERTGTGDRAARLVAELRERLAVVSATVAGRPRPRVAVVEWVDPPFTAGHWVPDLVVAAGGSRCPPDPGNPPARPRGPRSRRNDRMSWWSRRAGTTWTAPPNRRGWWASGCPDARFGRSTETGWSCGRVRGWSTAWLRWPRSCIPTPSRPCPAAPGGSPDPGRRGRVAHRDVRARCGLPRNEKSHPDLREPRSRRRCGHRLASQTGRIGAPRPGAHVCPEYWESTAMTRCGR